MNTFYHCIRLFIGGFISLFVRRYVRLRSGSLSSLFPFLIVKNKKRLNRKVICDSPFKGWVGRGEAPWGNKFYGDWKFGFGGVSPLWLFIRLKTKRKNRTLTI